MHSTFPFPGPFSESCGEAPKHAHNSPAQGIRKQTVRAQNKQPPSESPICIARTAWPRKDADLRLSQRQNEEARYMWVRLGRISRNSHEASNSRATARSTPAEQQRNVRLCMVAVAGCREIHPARVSGSANCFHEHAQHLQPAWLQRAGCTCRYAVKLSAYCAT